MAQQSLPNGVPPQMTSQEKPPIQFNGVHSSHSSRDSSPSIRLEHIPSSQLPPGRLPVPASQLPPSRSPVALTEKINQMQLESSPKFSTSTPNQTLLNPSGLVTSAFSPIIPANGDSGHPNTQKPPQQVQANPIVQPQKQEGPINQPVSNFAGVQVPQTPSVPQTRPPNVPPSTTSGSSVTYNGQPHSNGPNRAFAGPQSNFNIQNPSFMVQYQSKPPPGPNNMQNFTFQGQNQPPRLQSSMSQPKLVQNNSPIPPQMSGGPPPPQLKPGYGSTPNLNKSPNRYPQPPIQHNFGGGYQNQPQQVPPLQTQTPQTNNFQTQPPNNFQVPGSFPQTPGGLRPGPSNIQPAPNNFQTSQNSFQAPPNSFQPPPNNFQAPQTNFQPPVNSFQPQNSFQQPLSNLPPPQGLPPPPAQGFQQPPSQQILPPQRPNFQQAPPQTFQSAFPPQPSVTRSGFDRLWGQDNFDLLQNPNVLPRDRVVPPKIILGQPTLDAANCSPDVFRCTVTKIPENNNLLQKSRLPLGVLIHPFKDLTHLPVIQCNVIVRCRACRTYINPFVFFVDTKRWKCNLCYRINELPEEFQFDPVSPGICQVSRELIIVFAQNFFKVWKTFVDFSLNRGQTRNFIIG